MEGFLDNQELANQIETLAETNLVREIAQAVRKGNLSYAKAMCRETDKLPSWNSPLVKLLRNELFAGEEDHPWRVSELYFNQD